MDVVTGCASICQQWFHHRRYGCDYNSCICFLQFAESLEGGKPVTMASIGLGGSINKVKDFGKRVADKIMGKAGKYD